MRHRKSLDQSTVRKSFKNMLFSDLMSNNWELEHRTLLTASLVSDLNTTPDATLVYNSSDLQLYSQGNFIVAVEGGQSKKIIESSDGFYLNYSFQSGDTVYFGSEWSGWYSFTIGEDYARPSDVQLSRTVYDYDPIYGYDYYERFVVERSGSIIVDLDNENPSYLKVLNPELKIFEELSSPIADNQFESAFGIGNEKFVVSTKSITDEYSNFIFDANTRSFEFIPSLGPDSYFSLARNIESQGVSFLLVQNEVYRTDGTIEGTFKVFSSPHVLNDIQAIEFGQQSILSTSFWDYEIENDLTVTQETVMIVAGDVNQVPLTIFDSDKGGEDYPEPGWDLTRKTVKLMKSGENVLWANGGYFYKIRPDNTFHLITRIGTDDFIYPDGNGEFFFNGISDLDEYGYQLDNGGLYRTNQDNIEKVSDQALTSFLRLGAKSFSQVKNNFVYLQLRENNTSLYVTDGTRGGTTELTAIMGRLADLGYTEPEPEQLYSTTGKEIIFQNWDEDHGYEPWISDGTVEGTHILVDLVPGPQSSCPRAFSSDSDSVFFVARDAQGSINRYHFNLNTNEIVDSLEMPKINESSSPYPINLTRINNDGILYFTAWDGFERGKYTTDGFDILSRIKSENEILLLHNELYSIESDENYEFHLLKYNNQSEEFNAVVNLGSDSSFSGYYYSIVKFIDNKKEYIIIKPEYNNNNYIITDGTIGGTKHVSFDSSERYLDIKGLYNGNLIYSYYDLIYNYKLASYNIYTGDVNTVTGESRFLNEFDGQLAYLNDNYQLILTDVLNQENYVYDLPYFGENYYVPSMVLDSSRLMIVNDNLNFNENMIWAVLNKGSDSITELRINDLLNGGRFGGTIYKPSKTDIGVDYYFKVIVGSGDSDSSEIWKTDGTALGTKKIVGADQGVLDVDSIRLEVIDSHVFIIDKSLSFSYEVLKNGSLSEIHVHEYLSSYRYLDYDSCAVVNNRLLFTCPDPYIGYELFALPLSVSDWLTIDTIPDQNVDEGVIWDYQILATGSPQELFYSIETTAIGLSIDSKTGLISWTPDETEGGKTHNVKVTVRDLNDFNISDSLSFEIQINEVNSVPQISFIPDQVINPEVAWSYLVVAADSDVPLQEKDFALTGEIPDGLVIDSKSGILSWTPSVNQANKDFLVNIQVSDNGSPVKSNTRSMRIHVNTENKSPVFMNVSSQLTTVGTDFSFKIVATDPDEGQLIKYNMVSSSVSGAIINAETGLISFKPTSAGTYSILIQASDNGFPSKKATVTVHVTVLPPPVMISSVSVGISKGQVTALKISMGTHVDSVSASQLSNYKIVKIVTKKVKRVVKTIETEIKLKSATFDAKTGLVNLIPSKKFALNGVYQLRVDGSKISDVYKRAIDGDRNGTPGGLARYLLSKKGASVV